ncbi:MAG: UvrD-helicase domain-containing protein [Verrucomicrobia bacterium]|nr:UvrD-helicase domain-containing protein [Verrucomicrobiota bacterium]MDA1085957.1 UvrD-helicase domain-containing protein [Verrucomicrobiota bacterium]
MPKIDFEQALNAEQLAAATAPDGPALVLAAAGTGKTRTLVYRVAYLVEQGIDPGRILLLTFTNRAAQEMLERASDLVAGVSGIWGGTFHHLANRLLRRHAPVLGYGNTYTILDRDDSVTLVRRIIQDAKLQGREFPRPAVLLSLLGQATNKEQPLAGAVDGWFSDAAVTAAFGPEDVLKVLTTYTEQKRELDAMDFDDLLLNGLRLLREHDELRERYGEQFQHLLVDEYQDTNSLQAQCVDLLAGVHRNLTVVGDDFQSIYSWRGADYRNIMSFQQRYTDAKIYLLETNYRSVPEVLEVANVCIEGSRNQFPKTLRATREPYKTPTIVRLRDGSEQSFFVMQQVASLRREGYKLSEIAVLYRAHFHAMELQLQLSRDQVPYTITSGVRFFEQAHVKDVCCFLRVLQSDEDVMAFSRLLELLPGIGPKSSQRIWNKLGRKCDIYDLDLRHQIAEMLPAGAKAGWGNMEAAMPSGMSGVRFLGELVDAFVQTFYHDFAVETFENHRNRLDDLQGMSNYMERFESLTDFLGDIALLSNLDAEVEHLQEPGESLRLSTIHQAKGLEWSAVIVLWLVDGMFPSSRSLAESEEGEDEERRLFYVTVTRAKDELILCVPESRRMHDHSVIPCEPSRFITEIPPELVQEHMV